MGRSLTNPRPASLQKYYQVIDEWLVNGFNGTAAYQKVYPNANQSSAKKEFFTIKKIPQVQEYIKQARQAAYEEKCIDLTRVTEEIAKMAFCPNGDKDIPPSVKLKALEMLQKAMREDAKAQQESKEEITIGLEEDDEDNIEEESVQ